jgi:nucleoside diphosphate kinase
LQARYGYTKEQAEKEIDLFFSDMKLEGKDVIEVVRETLSDSTPGEEAHVQKKVI